MKNNNNLNIDYNDISDAWNNNHDIVVSLGTDLRGHYL